jgi:hypothetical protein
MTPQVLIGLVSSLGAAIRGNWSPCGESLQAQIHPLGESSRGNIWGVTMTAFTIGSMGAGAAICALCALLGVLLIPGMSGQLALALTATVAIAAGVLDLSPIKPLTPRRQVNQDWIGHYRGWVYGLGFGAQLGVGFAVFVMSWGYYAMLMAAFLSRSIWAAVLMGAVFGFGRGLLLFPSRWITTPDRLFRFHRRLMEIKAPVFAATAVATMAVGVLAVLI